VAKSESLAGEGVSGKMVFSLVFANVESKSPTRAGASPNTFQIRRCARQTKPLQACHPERSEGSVSGERSCAALRMTKRDGLFFEMYWGQAPPLLYTGFEEDRYLYNSKVLYIHSAIVETFLPASLKPNFLIVLCSQLTVGPSSIL